MTALVPGAGPPPTTMPMRLHQLDQRGRRLRGARAEVRSAPRSSSPAVRAGLGEAARPRPGRAKSSASRRSMYSRATRKPSRGGVDVADAGPAGLRRCASSSNGIGTRRPPWTRDHGARCRRRPGSGPRGSRGRGSRLGVEGDRVGAAQLVADVLVGDRDA